MIKTISNFNSEVLEKIRNNIKFNNNLCDTNCKYLSSRYCNLFHFFLINKIERDDFCKILFSSTLTPLTKKGTLLRIVENRCKNYRIQGCSKKCNYLYESNKCNLFKTTLENNGVILLSCKDCQLLENKSYI